MRIYKENQQHMNDQITILNCCLLNMDKNELLEAFNEGILMPTNVDMIIKLQKDKDFLKCFQLANFPVNDSQIIRFAAKILGTSFKDTVSGSDFFPLFYMHHKNNENVKIYLLGAEDGIAQKAMVKINTITQRKMIVGCYSPPFGFEKNNEECNKIIEMINKSDATVLAIGLGAPKQEKWIIKYKDKLANINRFICIGATIDFEAGKIKRAPKIVRNIGLEWLYRLIKEPKRLWKRYLVDDIPFIWLLLKQKLGTYRNPFPEITDDNTI